MRSVLLRPTGKLVQLLQDAEESCARGEDRSDGDILESARILFALRETLDGECDEEDVEQLLLVEEEVSTCLHNAILESPGHIATTARQNKLDKTEGEILILLTLSSLGLFKRIDTAFELQTALKKDARRRLEILRAITRQSRLVSSGLVILREEDIPTENEVRASSEFLVPLRSNNGRPSDVWTVKTYEELLDHLAPLVRTLYDRSESIAHEQAGWDQGKDDIDKASRRVKRLLQTLDKTLQEHHDWRFFDFFQSDLTNAEKLIVIALMGKDLGFLSPDNDLFTGEGLARAASSSVATVRHWLRYLKSTEPLRKENYIRVCGGRSGDPVFDDEGTLRGCEFELTRAFLDKLKIKSIRQSRSQAREPLMSLGQLVLSEDVREALNMAMVQVRQRDVLLYAWGLEKAFPYGRGLTLLFSGPPGTGKTASAEGLANELEKKIIVADYSQLQSCWVGETEKRIIRLFRQAADDDAVLFWDEADSMLFDRDAASRTWEVRDVNVLLTELERFEGVCILSTNRKLSLDKALERRIAVKVQFEPPTREMRELIWKKLLPETLPLGNDVDIRNLSEEDLTGGEIKNVVLNAARRALCRGVSSNVNMADFRWAIRLEKEGKWNRSSEVGFKSGH